MGTTFDEDDVEDVPRMEDNMLAHPEPEDELDDEKVLAQVPLAFTEILEQLPILTLFQPADMENIIPLGYISFVDYFRDLLDPLALQLVRSSWQLFLNRWHLLVDAHRPQTLVLALQVVDTQQAAGVELLLVLPLPIIMADRRREVPEDRRALSDLLFVFAVRVFN